MCLWIALATLMIKKCKDNKFVCGFAMFTSLMWITFLICAIIYTAFAQQWIKGECIIIEFEPDWCEYVGRAMQSLKGAQYIYIIEYNSELCTKPSTHEFYGGIL